MKKIPNLPAKAVAFYLFPSWLDVIFIALIFVIIYGLSPIETKYAVAIILTAGIIRYLIQTAKIGIVWYSSKNWYIKQTIILTAILLLVFLYEYNSFTWLFSLYYGEQLIIETIVSIYKRVLSK